MSKIVGTALVTGLVCSSVFLGVNPATASGSEVSGSEFEVIIRDDIAAGDRPRFEVVSTDFVGLASVVGQMESGQSLEFDGGAQLSDMPADPYLADQWGADVAGLDAVWSETVGNASTVIAVLDSGVGPGAEIGDRLLPGASFIDGDPHVDELGHGTWVAGVASASHDGVGIAGVCPGCSILPVQVADATGHVPWSAAAEGIVFAADSGADVINLSFGAHAMPQIVLDAVAYAHGRGVIVVGAAGNSGTDEPFYPAAGPGVIAVAGHDQALERYGWSSYGDWVDVAAPGCSVGVVGDAYQPVCGTSFAAPWVAGLIGLLLDQDQNLDPALAELRLESGAAPVAWVESGRVDPAASLFGAATFLDVPRGAYFAEPVAWMVEQGITRGTSATTFSPNDPVTRGQLATFLWRLSNAGGGE